jgi:hypothetical protein
MGYSDTPIDMSKIASVADVADGAVEDAALAGDNLEDAYRTLDERRRRIVGARGAIDSVRQGAFADDEGTTWSYAVFDNAEVRMLSAESDVASLHVPAQVEGLPVTSIGSDFGTKARSCEELVLPETVHALEPCAFRAMRALERVVFPRGLDTFDSSWLRGCRNLRELVLPGAVEKLDAGVFAEGRLDRLVIGAGTKTLEPGMFEKSRLLSIAVDAGNPWFTTDGTGVLSADGAVFVALCVPQSAFCVPDGVRKIAKKAFYSMEGLTAVELPDSLTVVGKYAFARSGLRAFSAPRNLQRIGERAFFYCRRLTHVDMGEALEVAESDAFSRTSVETLHFPKTLRELGVPIAVGTKLDPCGENATLTIASDNPHLHLDAAGGLYAHDDAGGKRFVRLLDRACRTYAVEEGTTAVADEAFSGLESLERVTIPAGVRTIGARAFHACRNLAEAALPDSVESIGDEAFFCTALGSLHIPAHLCHLGERALVTTGAYRGAHAPELRAADGVSDDGRFYVDGDLLCSREDDGVHVILYLGNEAAVELPAGTVAVEPYSFAGARALRELALPAGIKDVGLRAFRLEAPLARLRVELAEPLEGRRTLDLTFPETERGLREVVLALGAREGIDAETILSHYDQAILNPNDFDTKTERGLGAYEQARLVLERLADPVLMDPLARDLAERFLRTEAEPICLDIARHGDQATLGMMMDAGFVNEDNIETIIDQVATLRDAALTGFLLEQQRRRFGGGGLDFSL